VFSLENCIFDLKILVQNKLFLNIRYKKRSIFNPVKNYNQYITLNVKIKIAIKKTLRNKNSGVATVWVPQIPSCQRKNRIELPKKNQLSYRNVLISFNETKFNFNTFKFCR
ncbi:hypothetical protein BpHYR1_018605, partial [Brachionus plicatilis]